MAAVLSACEDNTTSKEHVDPNPKAHRDYIRLKPGMVFKYRLDSIIYDDFTNTIDTSRYQVIHKVKEQTLDSAGFEAFLLKATIQTIKEGTVRTSGLYTARKTPEEYHVFRNNQRVLALDFPLSQGHTWDGNIYNTQDSVVYEVQSIHEPATILSQRYDSTLLIQEKEQETLIERNATETRYAKDIGLIYRERLNLSFKGDSIPPKSIPWEEKANTGNIVRYRLQEVINHQ